MSIKFKIALLSFVVEAIDDFAGLLTAGKRNLTDQEKFQLFTKDYMPSEKFVFTKTTIQYCAKAMQTSFAEIRGFSWLFDEKILNFRWEANFQRKVMIIREAHCFQLSEFSNVNSFGTKIEFNFSSEKSLCSINDFEHVREILLSISSARTFPSILLMTTCQVRSCRDDSFAPSSHKGEACLFT